MPKKIAYRTATLERSYASPRSAVWDAVEAQIEARTAGVSLGDAALTVTEVPLSTEPPWRYVARLDGDHASPLCQTSLTIRDDGASCLVAWSCLVDPTDVDPGELDDLVATLTDDGRRQLDGFADRAQRAD